MISLQERLDQGEMIILDGAMGTELQRRGVPMHGVAWSAAALLTHPEVVRGLHEDYISSGADIITTNSFATARHVLRPAGMEDRVRELNRQSVALAREARDNAAANSPVYIAGSMSTFTAGLDWNNSPSTQQASDNYREQAEVLAEAGADLLFLEMMQDLELASCAISAAVATGLPTWIGFTCRITEDRSVMLKRDDESTAIQATLAVALDSLLPLGASGVSVMHTTVEDIPQALRVVQDHWQGPICAYAHSGGFRMPNWQFVNVISPEAYALEAQKWVELGVQIVGGCCGTGPSHIRSLKAQLPMHIAKVKRG